MKFADARARAVTATGLIDEAHTLIQDLTEAGYIVEPPEWERMDWDDSDLNREARRVTLFISKPLKVFMPVLVDREKEPEG